jgi:hypothetical protein
MYEVTDSFTGREDDDYDNENERAPVGAAG